MTWLWSGWLLSERRQYSWTSPAARVSWRGDYSRDDFAAVPTWGVVLADQAGQVEAWSAELFQSHAGHVPKPRLAALTPDDQSDVA